MYLSGSVVPSLRNCVMKPNVKPCWPSADSPAPIGVHSTRPSTWSGLARSAVVTAATPRCRAAGGPGMITSGANIAVRPLTASVLAAAAEKPRSAAISASAAAAGVCCARAGTISVAAVSIASAIVVCDVIVSRPCPMVSHFATRAKHLGTSGAFPVVSSTGCPGMPDDGRPSSASSPGHRLVARRSVSVQPR